MIGSIIKGLLAVGGVLLAGYAISRVIKVHQRITEELIAQQVEKEYREAFTAIIKEKKYNAVDVGIFNNQNEEIDTISIETDHSVDEYLYENQIIYVA